MHWQKNDWTTDNTSINLKLDCKGHMVYWKTDKWYQGTQKQQLNSEGTKKGNNELTKLIKIKTLRYLK